MISRKYSTQTHCTAPSCTLQHNTNRCISRSPRRLRSRCRNPCTCIDRSVFRSYKQNTSRLYRKADSRTDQVLTRNNRLQHNVISFTASCLRLRGMLHGSSVRPSVRHESKFYKNGYKDHVNNAAQQPRNLIFCCQRSW